MLHWRILSKQQQWLSIMKRTMIRVHLFASLKDAAGESSVELPLSTQQTVEEVYNSLVAQHPEHLNSSERAICQLGYPGRAE
jgi:molybdopterin converting factor small subunit